ncbi:Chitin synthase, class 3 [Thoreauomyces humboldtii]|nr:Chitin synthase, class 3 [Thoreauomyces humboldtii]
MNITPFRKPSASAAAAREQSLAQARQEPTPVFSWQPSYKMAAAVRLAGDITPTGAAIPGDDSNSIQEEQEVTDIGAKTIRSSTDGPARLQQRSGFPLQRSYDNLAEIAVGNPATAKTLPKAPSMKSQPTPPPHNRSTNSQSMPRRHVSADGTTTLGPVINTLNRQRSIKVDTPGRSRNGRAGQIQIDTDNGNQTVTTPSIERGVLRRKPSVMVRADRAQDESGARTPAMAILQSKAKYDIWGIFARTVTCCILPVCLRRGGGMTESAVQQAWREKLALCMIILTMCGALGFLTYGFVATVCIQQDIIGIDDFKAYTPATYPHEFAINGFAYNMTSLIAIHDQLPLFLEYLTAAAQVRNATGLDISQYFWPPVASGPPAACNGMFEMTYAPTCGTSTFPSTLNYCHPTADLTGLVAANPALRVGPIIFEWPDVIDDNSTLMVFQDRVLDMAPYLKANIQTFGEWTDQAIRSHLGSDCSKAFGGSPARLQMGQCLIALYAVGRIEEQTLGCIASDIILYVSLIMILSVVLIRFSMAVLFDWFVAWQLGKLQQEHQESSRAALRRSIIDQGIVPFPMKGKLDGGSSRASVEHSQQGSRRPSAKDTAEKRMSRITEGEQLNETTQKHASLSQMTLSQTQTAADQQRMGQIRQKMVAWSMEDASTTADGASSSVSDTPSLFSSPYGLEVYTIMMVAAYSEGEEGLRNTMESLASTNYSDDHKLIFIVADGLITGDGNKQSTPQILIDMLEMDKNWPMPPAPMSYVAISEGVKRHNMAQVYVAWYNHGGRCVPTILIVKCGTPEEASQPKPGNRGKRDSQIILMSFLQKVTFDDPMTPLDYDLFQKMHYLMGVTPDVFEIVLMVDADTKVAPDSVARMVASMVSDPLVMGLCGETRIANKAETWVSRIQVFEYYLSHHLAKAFESVFGGVTCLPGCFCMYRIKAPKGDGFWVPILCNPDIVATYSENRVDTLHKKNLLLLGEDRFLTTLMLGTFPHRKQIFVPRAFCKTVVPAEFKVLLSQRRRWINSTIHNLMELVLVRELCGVFCFSMQFVIMLELVGTVVLPAAIIFTFMLIIITIIGPTIPIIPLCLLGAILGLPAILIMLTTRRRIYIYWMLVYLCALPVWNFVLPVYAFWHFDDFSWGQTRKVAGEEGGGDKKGHGGGEGERDGGNDVPRRRWVEWETERRKAIVLEFEMEKGRAEYFGPEGEE